MQQRDGWVGGFDGYERSFSADSALADGPAKGDVALALATESARRGVRKHRPAIAMATQVARIRVAA